MAIKAALKRLILGTSILALSGCTGSAVGEKVKTTDAAAAAIAEEVGGNAPAMWKITDADSTLYVLGTFHILPTDLEWKTPVYEAAMADAENTITEADTDSPAATLAVQQAVAEYGLNAPGTTLSGILGEERFARFSTACEKFGIPAAALESFRPWLATLTLSVTALQKNGFDPAAGVDSNLTKQAIAEGDTISHFETAEEQIRILASLDEEEMLANFDVSLEQLEDFEALSEQMLTSWATGDTAGLESLFVEELQTQSPDAFEKVLVTRNMNWANQVEKILAGEGDYMIAVGAAHLVGEKSLLDLLDDRGISAERIQ